MKTNQCSVFTSKKVMQVISNFHEKTSKSFQVASLVTFLWRHAKSLDFNEEDFGSTWGHFSFKWGHTSSLLSKISLFGPTRSTTQTASWSCQPFSQPSLMVVTNRQTHRQIRWPSAVSLQGLYTG